MRKLFTTNLLGLLFLTSAAPPTFAYDNGFYVQVAAFDTKVSLDYFKGLSNVFHYQDVNNIHKYYISGFDNESAADLTLTKAKSLGYNARVINMDQVKEDCRYSCGSSLDNSNVKSIFFDFDKSNLRSQSKYELEKLNKLLNKNPEYSVELRAHTDSRGTHEYNDVLSEDRAKSTKSFLISHQVPSDRITIKTYGERSPIAKNELSNGADTPKGRQLNRRVELVLYDRNGKIVSTVEDISVPPSLVVN